MCLKHGLSTISQRPQRLLVWIREQILYGFYLLINYTGNPILIFAIFMLIGAFIRCVGGGVPEYCFWSSLRFRTKRMESGSAEADKSDLRPGRRDTLKWWLERIIIAQYLWTQHTRARHLNFHYSLSHGWRAFRVQKAVGTWDRLQFTQLQLARAGYKTLEMRVKSVSKRWHETKILCTKTRVLSSLFCQLFGTAIVWPPWDSLFAFISINRYRRQNVADREWHKHRNGHGEVGIRLS